MSASPDRIRDILRSVIDPELAMNIVDLGLIYGVEVTPERIDIALTMTSPACPMGEMILDDVRAALDAAFPERSKNIELVWDPPWHPRMMSERARRHFDLTDDAAP